LLEDSIIILFSLFSIFSFINFFSFLFFIFSFLFDLLYFIFNGNVLYFKLLDEEFEFEILIFSYLALLFGFILKFITGFEYN